MTERDPFETDPDRRPASGPAVSAVVVHDGADPGAKVYADYAAEDLGLVATDPGGVDGAALVVASTVVVFTGVTADGSMPGVRWVVDEWDALVGSGRRVAIGMVSLAPVADEQRIEQMVAAVTPDQLAELKFFQLRGKLDTSRLGLREKIGVRAAVEQIRAKAHRTPDEQAMLDAGGQLDFTRREALGPLLRWARDIG